MKRALLLGVICCMGIFSSCMNEKFQNELLSTERESQQEFIKRNSVHVVEIQDFILANQELVQANQELISSEFKGSLFAYFSSNKSDELGFDRLVNRAKQNVRLNQNYYSFHKDKTVIVEEVLAEINQNNNKYTGMLLDDSGDRKTCMVLYMQNVSDCRESFYRDATFAVLAAGVGGFISGLLPAINAGWGLLECQNRAQRNFDYCLGNI
ncbi:hypothetical protein [Aquirufa antheringensis]|jgi:hypothetical protein|uniref:Uncharacterized protein n=1 Tax=Aquirufa antheringensis TaxID=2516559 RepID=A0A4Q9BET3_9BACT|nr:hypothetical protein [Aquirufa antheringensis]MCZ2484263.1 hypothetical protein [Aquirufa antheringensis]MCZ2487868.1 hypothetical protein [Aquirufa antheringensis]MCZ2489307.1 hypothetical protein [Aquirufa antheringensis]TBH74527.1 hypothetical protein EWU20_05125 [Aquirufa antheringensis]